MLISPDAQMFLSMIISADSGCDVSVCASLLVNHTSQEDERLHLPVGLSTNCDWCVSSCVNFHQLGLLPVDLEPCPR